MSVHCRPNWETRHGAALGLKEILKLQGGGGGQIGALFFRVRSLEAI